MGSDYVVVSPASNPRARFDIYWALVDEYPKLRDALSDAVSEWTLGLGEDYDPDVDEEEAILDIDDVQLGFLDKWLQNMRTARITAENADGILAMAHLYELLSLKEEVLNELRSRANLGLSAFQLYILGQAYDVPELVEQHKPAVITEFDRFCDEYLSEFMAKYKKPGIGRIIAALAKEWKQKRDQEAGRHENDTVAQRIAEKEQAFQRERQAFNNQIAGKDRDITSLTSRLNEAKTQGKRASAELVKYGNTLSAVISVPSTNPTQVNNIVRTNHPHPTGVWALPSALPDSWWDGL